MTDFFGSLVQRALGGTGLAPRPVTLFSPVRAEPGPLLDEAEPEQPDGARPAPARAAHGVPEKALPQAEPPARGDHVPAPHAESDRLSRPSTGPWREPRPARTRPAAAGRADGGASEAARPETGRPGTVRPGTPPAEAPLPEPASPAASSAARIEQAAGETAAPAAPVRHAPDRTTPNRATQDRAPQRATQDRAPQRATQDRAPQRATQDRGPQRATPAAAVPVLAARPAPDREAPTSPALGAPEARPIVEISIGRVEIRSRPAPPAAGRRATAPGVQPLADYLAAKHRGA
jgi:hypothetical protein